MADTPVGVNAGEEVRRVTGVPTATAPLRQQQLLAAQARLQILNKLTSAIQAPDDWRR